MSHVDKQVTMNSGLDFKKPILSDSDEQQSLLGKLTKYNYGQMLLYDWKQLFEKIYAEQELDRQIQFFALYSLLFSAIYGFLLGMYAGGFQILAGAFKFPVLLFGTLFLCLPALYVFNVLLGSKLSFRQTLTVLLASTYLMSTLLAALAPILLFFILTTTSRHFISLITIIICTVSGIFAVGILWKGMNYLTVKSGSGSQINSRVIKVWSLIYAIVGTQLSWGLRPFIGEKGVEFVLLRSAEIEGNFYIAVFNLFKSFLSGLL